MEKVFGLLEKYLMGPMGKLSTFQFVRAIMAAGMATIPFTIVGSAFLIVGILPQAFPFLTGIWASSFDKISNLYMAANWMSMGILALYFAIVMGYELTKIKAEEMGLALDPVQGALLSMMAFLMTTVQYQVVDGVFAFQEGENMINGVAMGNFPSRLGSSGMFTAIIVATLAVFLYKTAVANGWTIKLPDVVPPGVGRSFTALVPCFLVATTMIVLNGILVGFLGTDLFELVAIPFGFVKNIAGQWYGLLVINFLIHALWSVGIHGANIVGGFLSPITLANLEHNQQVLKSGQGQYEALAGEFQNMFVIMGGSGGTLGMCIWMCFMAKSEQLSVLGKAAIGPGLFNINEPLIFGVPIMYNPALIIPFICGPTITSIVVLLLLKTGIFPPIIAQVPWCTPIGIGAFLGTASIMGVVLCLIGFAMNLAIYFPFLMKYDRDLVKQEAEQNA